LRHRQEERELLLRRVIEVSDIERRRIASDLHDGVVQDLAGVSFELAGAAREPDLPPDAAALLDSASTTVRSSVNALRSMLIEIYPPDLAARGLRAAIEEIGTDTSTKGVEVEVDVAALPAAIADERAAILYRTAREAVHNAVLHARANRIVVRGGGRADLVWLSVTDDGVGFDPASADDRAAEGHFGLRGLRGLVQDAGGTMRAETAPGKGTTVFVEVRKE
jgi:signal transduction histidine kinase